MLERSDREKVIRILTESLEELREEARGLEAKEIDEEESIVLYNKGILEGQLDLIGVLDLDIDEDLAVVIARLLKLVATEFYEENREETREILKNLKALEK